MSYYCPRCEKEVDITEYDKCEYCNEDVYDHIPENKVSITPETQKLIDEAVKDFGTFEVDPLEYNV